MSLPVLALIAGAVLAVARFFLFPGCGRVGLALGIGFGLLTGATLVTLLGRSAGYPPGYVALGLASTALGLLIACWTGLLPPVRGLGEADGWEE